MNRSLSTAAYWLAVCLAAAFGGNSHCLAAEPAGAASMPVRGEMVDADTPAAYRLPVVGIFASAQGSARDAQRRGETEVVAPDDGG